MCRALSMCHRIILIANFSQDCYVNIDRGFSALGNSRDVVDGLNATEKYPSVNVNYETFRLKWGMLRRF